MGKSTELKMSTDERVALAKEKTDRLVGRTRNLLRQRASNEIVMYSDAISKQVGRSYAAHAYESLKRTMFEHELVSLCALWDSARNEKAVRDRDSVPAVVRLIDDDFVVRALMSEYYDQNSGLPELPSEPDWDDATRRLINAQRASNRVKFAEEQATKVQQRLARALDMARKVVTGDMLKSVKHHRDHTIAHVLSNSLTTLRQPERVAKYGDEAVLFDRTSEIVGLLHLSVNYVEVDWPDSRRIEERYAKAFWHGVTINVLE